MHRKTVVLTVLWTVTKTFHLVFCTNCCYGTFNGLNKRYNIVQHITNVHLRCMTVFALKWSVCVNILNTNAYCNYGTFDVQKWRILPYCQKNILHIAIETSAFDWLNALFDILKKLQLYNQHLVMKMAMNQNQMRKTCWLHLQKFEINLVPILLLTYTLFGIFYKYISKVVQVIKLCWFTSGWLRAVLYDTVCVV